MDRNGRAYVVDDDGLVKLAFEPADELWPEGGPNAGKVKWDPDRRKQRAYRRDFDQYEIHDYDSNNIKNAKRVMAEAGPDPSLEDTKIIGGYIEQEIQVRKKALQSDNRRLSDKDAYQAAYLETMAEIRPMAGTGQAGRLINKTKKNEDNVKLIDHSLQYYPAAWVNNAEYETRADGGSLRSKVVSRGYFSARGSGQATEINTQGTGQGAQQTMTHETGHLMETSNRYTYGRAEEWRNSRTSGESLVTMSKVTGNMNYDKDEVTKPDKFFHPYIGKEYSHESTEVISMGIENLIHQPATMAKDPDYRDFILGLLAEG